MSVDPVSLAITVALDAASMALAASKKIEGPRVADLSATVADYGTPLNYIYGVRRIEGACFYCEPMIEKKHHTKGKGGKYTEYRYFGTFAIIVADHAISLYRRIWFDRHLVYSISGGEVEDPTDHSTLSQFMRKYLGSSTQSADPRMVAYITSKEGANRTPAYLDISYLMFEALPLEFLGNRFPQVSVEVDGVEAEVANDWRVDFPFSITVQAPDPYPDCYPGGFGVSGMLFSFSWEIRAFTEAGDGGGFFTGGSWSTDGTYNDLITSVTNNGVTVTCTLTPSPGEFTFDFTTDVPDLQNQSPNDTHYVLDGTYQSGPCLSPFGHEWAVDGDGNALTFNNGGTLSPIGPPGSGDLTLYTAGWAISLAQLATGSPLPPLPAPITLGDICADIARRAGMAAGDYDFTALDQVIAGFSWTIAQGKQIVAPLLDIYDSDIFCHNFQLSGRKRGSATADGPEIDAAFLVREQRQQASSTSGPLYHILMEAESDLPRRVFASYADTTGDQQPNTAVAQRNIAATVTTREVPIDMTNLALTPDDAQPLVERWLRRQWMGATTFTHTIAPGEIAIECADLRLSNLNGQVLVGRLTRMVLRADRSIQTEWQLDGAVVLDMESDMGVGNVSRLIDSPGAPQLGRPPDTIFSPQLARAFVLDIPLVSDADDQTTPFIYLTAGRLVQGGTFPGAEIQQSDTDLDDWVAGWDSISSTAEAVWGVCENALGDALPWIPDRGNVLVVNMPNGSLDSQADEYLNANPAVNLAAIGTHAGGWEIVQFGEAVVQSEGIWQVSNFYRRGVRGTEGFIAGHVAGELFILLQSLTVHDLGAGEIGDTDYYRAVTNTTNADEAEEVSVDYSAQAHRPLSPVNVVLTRNAGSGDWHGEWVRRTRVGGGTLNGQDVPLGEASEAYRVKVMNGVTVVRTINVTSPEFDYLSATQVTDWGSPQVNLTVAVCQMNPTLSIEGAATTASA